MSYKFRTRFHCSSIQGIERLKVESETDKTVRFLDKDGKESRENKKSEYQNWFDSEHEARTFLARQCEKEIDYLKSQIARLEKIKSAVSTIEVKHD